MNSRKMEMVDVVAFLRQNLLKAVEQKNRDELANLKIAFSLLVEASYEKNDSETTAILVKLEDAARDGVMGVSWKSDIPSVEMINAVFATQNEP
jgi:hypothetical protein